ncbi:hypothetical protein K432DRAFT_442708 [Lepidopterella palustris CBS 459.81]|uniref:Uncharacterized protein n=1 Tax=Lepidopterella palustris CBS 459.81 TaxID=1314670 RepID=A0A8E2EBL0_9PEZI|nr:hypothetical protein K432DRAFT_442708 [Lepidopterella palustris CBS 459.81]
MALSKQHVAFFMFSNLRREKDVIQTRRESSYKGRRLQYRIRKANHLMKWKRRPSVLEAALDDVGTKSLPNICLNLFEQTRINLRNFNTGNAALESPNRTRRISVHDPKVSTRNSHRTTRTPTAEQPLRLLKSPRAIRPSGVEWRGDRDERGLKAGRVLLIEYLRPDPTETRWRVISQEIREAEALHSVYVGPPANYNHFRVFHVQNAPWAAPFLLQRFNIKVDRAGKHFGKWVKSVPQAASRNPRFSGKTWRSQQDPWRGVSLTAFSLDYVHYDDPNPITNDYDEPEKDGDDDEFDNAFYQPIVQDTTLSRLSVYIQHRDGPGSEVEPPPGSNAAERAAFEQKLPDLESLDNGNAIVIFDTTATGFPEDFLIPPQQEVESRWLRLPFYLDPEQTEDSPDDIRIVSTYTSVILGDVFNALSSSWQTYIDICSNYMGQLEDSVHRSPSDDSYAPELWINHAFWAKLEKLVFIHHDVIKETRSQLHELIDHFDDDILMASQSDFDLIANVLQDELVKPTAGLSSVMYQAVAFRDSRLSLDLNTSLWRLSWITFIFLPLTFLAGVFGMNVTPFDNRLSLGIYPITAVPLMVTVLLLWLSIKYLTVSRDITPWQRGIYKSVYRDLAKRHPDLWSAAGPRSLVMPEGFFARTRWRLVCSWFNQDKISLPKPDKRNLRNEGLGFWGRIQVGLLQRWLAKIAVGESPSPLNLELGK